MKLIQFVLLAFVLLAVIKVIQKYRQRGMPLLEFLFWLLIWLAAAVTIVFPETTQVFADLLGIGRGADLILYFGLLAAFYLIFRLHMTHDRLEQATTEIVRALALGKLNREDPGATGTREGKERRV